MQASTLIRIVDRVETPAVGLWTIAPNQAVAGTRRHLGRHIAGAGRTLDGSLLVADHNSGSAMELTIAVDDLPFPDASTLHYEATGLVPTREGIWLLNGELTAGAVTRPLRALVRYHGVYRHGDRAAAWLTLHACIDLASFAGRRMFSGRYINLTADLNADAPIAQAPRLRRMAGVAV
jgi:hypothetical protein